MVVNINGVACGYYGKKVISNLSFDFRSGEAVCVLGPNGIGKTTLFKTLIGQLDPLEGEILVDGYPLTKMNAKERARVFSYVPQTKNSNYRFTVYDIILMGRAGYIRQFGSPTPEDYKVVDEVLGQLHISGYKERKYYELSGGEQQIVLLARAMAQGAKYILLDEPASNLDYYNQKKLIDTIQLLTSDGTGVLMISHNPDHAFACCNHVLLIDQKGVCTFGSLDETITMQNLTSVYGTSIGVLKYTDALGATRHTCYLV